MTETKRKPIDRTLSCLVLGLGAAWLALLGLEKSCAWLAVARLAPDGTMLKGKPMAAVFERTPIVPSRIILDSERPHAVTLEYDGGRLGWMRYPSVYVLVSEGAVKDVFGRSAR